jgi:hypothetical protein
MDHETSALVNPVAERTSINGGGIREGQALRPTEEEPVIWKLGHFALLVGLELCAFDARKPYLGVIRLFSE